MGLGFAAFGAELPELEARCHERLHYARPTVLAGPRTRRGRRLIIYYHGPGVCVCSLFAFGSAIEDASARASALRLG